MAEQKVKSPTKTVESETPKTDASVDATVTSKETTPKVAKKSKPKTQTKVKGEQSGPVQKSNKVQPKTNEKAKSVQKSVKKTEVPTPQSQPSEPQVLQPQPAQPAQPQQPFYIDPNTGQAVYFTPNTNPAGANMLNGALYNAYAGADVTKAREERKKKGQRAFGLTSLIVSLSGLAVFAIGWFFFYFLLGAENLDPSLWFTVIIGWLFGPFLMFFVPPVLYLIGFIFGIVAVSKAPKMALSWIGFAVSLVSSIIGIYLIMSIGGASLG